MSKTKWTIESRRFGGVEWDAIVRENGNPIASIFGAGWDKASYHSHINLIAAAPDLYSKLAWLLEFARGGIYDEQELEIEALLAKARGE